MAIMPCNVSWHPPVHTITYVEHGKTQTKWRIYEIWIFLSWRHLSWCLNKWLDSFNKKLLYIQEVGTQQTLHIWVLSETTAQWLHFFISCCACWVCLHLIKMQLIEHQKVSLLSPHLKSFWFLLFCFTDKLIFCVGSLLTYSTSLYF